ncbi:unnamed protein product [Larinioides sclopetarius]|uniref:Uncharacterized protein n=1 Tax=Larinioides sclopetarius TaxID=280406 RepID=A0AAV2BGH4_9ARAC
MCSDRRDIKKQSSEIPRKRLVGRSAICRPQTQLGAKVTANKGYGPVSGVVCVYVATLDRSRRNVFLDRDFRNSDFISVFGSPIHRYRPIIPQAPTGADHEFEECYYRPYDSKIVTCPSQGM